MLVQQNSRICMTSHAMPPHVPYAYRPIERSHCHAADRHPAAQVNRAAVAAVEQDGIVFLDEIDKIVVNPVREAQYSVAGSAGIAA